MINSKMIKKLLLIYLIALAHLSNAQSKIDYSQLRLNDSVRVQTVYGSFYYGLFLAQTDSLLSLHINMVSDTLQLAKKQIYELEILSQQPPVAEAQQQPPAVDNKQSPALPPVPGKGVQPPSGAKMALQVLAGTGGLAVGAIGGLIGGAIIGGGLTGFSNEGVLAGLGIGAVAGGLLTSSYLIYSIGNTKEVKGKFLKTLGGVIIGSIGTIPISAIATQFTPLAILVPFVPAFVGTLFYNSTRYAIPKPLGSGLLPPPPFSGPAYGMGGRPVFQVNLLTLTF